MIDNGNGNGKPGKNGITAAEAIEAAKGSRGFVTTIAKQLGCPRVAQSLESSPRL